MATILYGKACDGQNLDSCNSVGNIEYQKGNHEKAFVAYQKSCDLGSLAGCSNLGILEYERGNIEQALALLEESCDERSDQSTPGCFNLWLLLEEVDFNKG